MLLNIHSSIAYLAQTSYLCSNKVRGVASVDRNESISTMVDERIGASAVKTVLLPQVYVGAFLSVTVTFL